MFNSNSGFTLHLLQDYNSNLFVKNWTFLILHL